jgi:hypothetical protein
MTPKEKAKELVNSFYNNAESRNKIGAFDVHLHKYNCKKCALILVYELIDSELQYQWTKSYEPNDYWEEVKKEIQKL